ncbi:MAG: phosphoadenosine phosphosulfate reductase, partial [Blastocatellia bacterium]|nr:phosphoadenosine phosphosulfate reductase [Blastocatellia bacterium]
MTLSLSPDLATTDLEALAEQAGRELHDALPHDVLRWAWETFGTRFAITSSMGDAVLAHLASKVAPGIDVVFLDTGYHFAETLGVRDAIGAVLPVSIRTVLPLRTVAEQDAEFGPRLHDRDPSACCAMRKVEPLNRALAPYRAWASGLRR